MDTAARSLSHWSEDGRAEMDAFYVLARRDYELLAKALDHPAWLRAQAAGRERIELLDVACGSGKFPDALQVFGGVGQLAGELEVGYGLLDPSAFSLAEAAGVLRAPFVESGRYETLMEDLDDGVGPFDVVWATHALYALVPEAVPAATARMLAAVKPGGSMLIAQGSREGHYLRFYEHFLADLRDGQGTPYTAAEDLADALRAHGASVRVERLSYDHTLALEDDATVEGYLQRCAFDDTVPLAAMLDAPRLGPYLRSSRDEAAGLWRFHHEVDVILLGDRFGSFA